MVTWAEFASEAPELAALGEARFRATGLVIVGTLRAHGWPAHHAGRAAVSSTASFNSA